jgi:PAS domain S-box-containing protein
LTERSIREKEQLVSPLLVEALLRSESKFRQLLEAAPDAMVIYDMRGMIHLVNRQAEHMFGRDRQALLGIHVDQLVSPDHRATEPKESLFLAGLGSVITSEGLRADGTKFPVEVNVSQIVIEAGTMVIAAIRDVTVRRQAQEALRRTVERTNHAERATGRGSWEWDVVTNKATWSEGMYRLFGVDPATFKNTNENFLALVLPEDRERMLDAMTAALESPGHFLQEYRLRRPDGQVRHLRGEGNAVPGPDGKARLLYGFVQDVTQRKEMEQSLQEAQERQLGLERETARKEHERLRQLDEFKSQFIAMVAHDLNNHLTPLKVNANLIGRELERHGVPAYKPLVHLDSNLSRLADFLKDLLDVCRLQAGQLSLHATQVDLVGLLVNLLDAWQSQAGTRNVTLSYSLPASLTLTADARRLEQVVSNLVSNALKATHAGGLVNVQLTVEGNEACLSVSDDGKGIASQDIPRLFQLFARLGPQEAHTGTGLGLYICRGIVEQHGGRIWCTSEGPGKGATFHLTLPLARGAQVGPNDPSVVS